MKTFGGLWASKPKGLLDGCYPECPGAVYCVHCEMLFSCVCVDAGCLTTEVNLFPLKTELFGTKSTKKKKVEVLVKPLPGFLLVSVFISFLMGLLTGRLIFANYLKCA